MRYVFILLLFNICLIAGAQVSKTEKKIVASVDAHHNEALKLLEEVVNINSGSMNFEGVKKVGMIFKARLDALGFETKWIDGKDWGRSGHLVAEHKGKGKTMLLIGHLDTVFELSSPFQQYKSVNDSTVSGPGVGDMKGGDVVIIQAMQALKESGALNDMNIIIVMTGDEELSGKPLSLARRDLIEAAKKADIAIGFEDGDGNPKTAVVARRSSSGWQLNVEGVPAHSSQVFTKDIGAGAIYEAARIVNGFYEALSKEENLTFNPGMILGGTSVDHEREMDGGSAYGKSNIVAKNAVVTGDIRAISPEQLKMTQETMQKIVAEHRPQTKAEISFGEGYPPLAPVQGNYDLLARFSRVSQDLGFGEVRAVNPRDAGAADISFTAPYVEMAMDGLGPGSAGGHTVNETADPRSIAIQAKRAAVLMYRLSQEKVNTGQKK
ncbi:MAG TPA: M20/M25/M40 family metallo-hydrolase [Cyclobacteriaceae bacterium]|nr:M20/M25/M40 family metallo-hydrolase [Cyclobacteriaceae bacterium]